MNNIILAQSNNKAFLQSLFIRLSQYPLLQSANLVIVDDKIICDVSAKKNNITLKQIQTGIEFFRAGWNEHRKQFSK